MADEKELKGKSDKSILALAKQRFKQCVDDHEEERAKQLDDLIFADVDQWPADIRAARENDVNGSRPCLTIDKISQYINQVTNDMRQNRPAIKARPIDDGSDPKTAKVFQELIRHIEESTNADVAYLTAGESAVKIGEGYFRFVTDFVDENSFDQEIQFKPIKDMFSVYLGPHMLPDGSDTEYGFVLEDVPLEKFKRDFPKAKADKESFLSDGDFKYWTNGDTVRVCEYFYYDFKPETLLLLEDGSSLLKSEYDQAVEQGFEPPAITKTRPTQTKSVKWCKLSGLEVLEKQDWAGKYIPIVKVEGRASLVKGKRILKGLVRPAKDSLRAYNYWASTLTEKLALSPKVPFIGAVGQFATHGDKWNKANSVNFSRLEYDPINVDGVMVPAPQRQASAPMEAALLQQLQTIEHDIQTSLGMFKAAVGQSDPQQSGRALQALQRQTDTGTFHFPDNVAISIRHGGRILIDLIPKIMDTARVVRILGEDGESGSAMIDPQAPKASQTQDDGMGNIQTIYNLGVGKYDVTASVGPSYGTKRAEQSDMMLQVMQNQPELMQTIGDLIFKSFDWPMADKISDRLKKMLPPQLQEPEDGQPAIPAQVQAAMAQIQQQHQELDQKAQALSQAEQEIDKKSMDVQRKQVEVFVQESRVKTDAIKLELEKHAAELTLREQQMGQGDTSQIDIAKAQLDAQTKLEIAKIKQETDLQIALLQAEDSEDVNAGNENMAALVDSLQENVAKLMSSHQELAANVAKPKTSKAKAVKQADGSWELIRQDGI